MNLQSTWPVGPIMPADARLASGRSITLHMPGNILQAAFAWGAVDRLLESSAIGIDRVRASGAGVFNALALAYGMALGGNRGGRTALATFWRRVAHLSDAPGSMACRAFGGAGACATQRGRHHHGQLWSALEKTVDFTVIHDCSPIDLAFDAIGADYAWPGDAFPVSNCAIPVYYDAKSASIAVEIGDRASGLADPLNAPAWTDCPRFEAWDISVLMALRDAGRDAAATWSARANMKQNIGLTAIHS